MIKLGPIELIASGSGGKSMYEDDWMNPELNRTVYSHKSPKRGDKDFIIERKKKIIVTGPSGSITRWDFWSSHETKELRDAELLRLREAHPAWQLRSRDRDLWLESLGVLCGEFGRNMPA